MKFCRSISTCVRCVPHGFDNRSTSKMKMAAEVRWLLTFLASSFISATFAENIYRRFEYKYSFKPPYFAQKDGSVPFWEYGGNAIASSEKVRLAPSMTSQKGGIWVKQPVSFDWWEIELVFRITGPGRIGADGLAFWYTTEKGGYNGTVFGSADNWNGLGVIFDSFDNDNKHNNPYIMAVLNDGSKSFNHVNDGESQTLAGCMRDFRNTRFPTRARIEYYRNVLTIFFNNGKTNNEQDYEVCLHVENVVLPKNGFFGVTAATGGLADDHDVSHFLTTSLYSGELPVSDSRVPSEEEDKLNREYQAYQKKLEQQKEDYKKEHPEMQNEFEDAFETDNQRELRQIFAGQSQIFDVIRGLSKQLDQLIGKQEQTLSLISQIQMGGVQATGQAGQPIQLIDTIRRHEVDAVLNNQNVILQTAREIKSFVGDVHSRAEAILNNQARAPTAQVQPMGYDYHSLISEMRDSLNTLKKDIAQAGAKLSGSSNCPSANCLTTTMFLIFIAIQMIILLGYNLYRDNKEAQAKKFY